MSSWTDAAAVGPCDLLVGKLDIGPSSGCHAPISSACMAGKGASDSRCVIMNLGPWTFTKAPPVTAGTVLASSTNAPAGTLWGGNPRQPVLKAHAEVESSRWKPWSVCSLQVKATAPLQLGRESKELIELEVVLYGHQTLRAAGGLALATGFASILDAAGNAVAQIGVQAAGNPPLPQVYTDQRVHATDKTTACLSPGTTYTVEGTLNVQAAMPRQLAWNLGHAEAQFMKDDGNGLPSGLMLIVQSRGAC